MVAVSVSLLVPASAHAPTPESSKPVMVSSARSWPAHYKRRTVRFVPAARPSAEKVRRIVWIEAKRWRVSAWHLAARIGCESGFHWWAANGQYHGLGQFAYSTFARGVSTMPRRVVVKRSRIVRRHTRLERRYSDGSRKVERGFAVKVRRTRILRGRLPRRPDWLHGWAQVRIMAQAMAGRSAVHDSEWSCR